ncbi:MAG: propionyl-CoA carboxylase, partial [Rubrivivax sp.]|nr:propionyl-CoA carboxylase [Rubrivivax sp.]
MSTPEFDPGGEWAEELAELKQRREWAARMGGEEAVARFKARGRLTARERIERLLDDGSFREMGRITGRGRYDDEGRLTDLQAVNAIIGTGRVEGRKIVVSADDYTIRAGSSEGTISDKWVYAERMALAQQMPLV